jgi:F-BAR domain only protein
MLMFLISSFCRCQVMLTGSMVVSFPAGIVRVLTENSNPNPLSFRIKNTANVREFFFNKQLIVE